jgi:hypothetical protein
MNLIEKTQESGSQLGLIDEENIDVDPAEVQKGVQLPQIEMVRASLLT